MQTLHDMLFALRDRVQGAAPAQSVDENAAVTVGFQAGEWQALMHELDASVAAQQDLAPLRGELDVVAAENQALRHELDATAAENQALRHELEAVKSAVAAPAPAPAAAAPAAVSGSMPPVPDAPLV